MNEQINQKKKKGISYAKWGYIFILPFFVAYIAFTLIPQLMTFYNSFFENYMNGLKHVGPNFVGFGNFVKLFSPDRSGTIGMLKYFGNTLILWCMGAVPQVLIAPEPQRAAVLQDGYLYAEPDHGFCILDAVLHPVLSGRAREPDSPVRRKADHRLP